MLRESKDPAARERGEAGKVSVSTNELSKPREPFQSAYGLALEQFDWGYPNKLQTQWLHSQGVKSLKALLSPWPVGATRVTFDGDYFDPDPCGVNALTFVCFDRGEPIDVCAWFPRTGKLATYLGRAVFLGDEDDLFNPATWFGGDDLLIHSSPIEWLRADREGVVILDEAKAGPYLAQCRSVFCADAALAARVRKLIRPKPILKIHTERKVANG